jgi:hypothetical protein
MIMIRLVLVQIMSSFLLSHVMGLDAIVHVHLIILCLLSRAMYADSMLLESLELWYVHCEILACWLHLTAVTTAM